MSHSNLTRWIEDAEARNFHEAATFDQNPADHERHYLHLGGTIATVPSWFRMGISPGSLAAVGCHALDYACHQLSRIRH